MRRVNGKTRGLVVLLGFLAGLALAVLAYAQAEPWKAPPEAKKLVNPVKATPESVAKGKEIFAKVCVVCHGEKGDGKGPAGAALTPPPGNFTDPAVQAQTDGEIFWKITNGRGAMISYKDTYSETDRWNLVNFIRTFAKAEKK